MASYSAAMALAPAQAVSPARLESVRASGLLDTDPEAAFDRLAALAAELLEAPLAFVTVVDGTHSTRSGRPARGRAPGSREP